MHQHAREGTVEEVGVLADRLLESRSTERSEGSKIVAAGSERQSIHLLELLELNEVVVSVLVEVTASRADIGFVLVVGAGQASRCREDAVKTSREGGGGTANGPRREITIEDCSVKGEETTEVVT